MSRSLPFVLTVLFACTGFAAARAADSDATSFAQFDWMPPSLTVDRFVLLPKAHYSSDNGAGLGLQLVRPFRFVLSDRRADDSELKLKGRLNTDGHGKFEARLTTYFGEGRWSLRSRLEYSSLVRRFWGVGDDTPSSNEEKFRARNLLGYVELHRRFGGSLGVGLRAEWQDYHYLEVEEGGLLDTVAYRGRDRAADNAVGAGLVFEWDTRDSPYEPSQGNYLQGFAMLFREVQGGDHNFDNWYLEWRRFVSPGLGTVLASQVFFFAVDDEAPVWRLAQLGGRPHSRGYRRGRFIDKNLLTAQLELRRALFWRVDGVVFAGAGSIAPSLAKAQLDELRPTVGGGIRFRLRKRRDLLVRGDLAFGQDSVRAYFSLGHAF